MGILDLFNSKLGGSGMVPGVGAAPAPNSISGFQSWLDPRRNAILGFAAGLGSGNTPGEGIAAGLQGAMQGRQADTAYATSKKAEAERAAAITATQRALAEFPDLAAMAVPGADMGPIVAELFRRKSPGYGGAAAQPTDDIQEFEFAKQNGFSGTFAEWMQTGKNGAAGPQIGLAPQWGQDANQNWVLGQMSTDGRFVPTKMPDGVNAIPPPEMAGAKKTATVDAATSGAARAALPGAEQAYAITQQAFEALNSPVGQKGQAENFGSTAFIPNQLTFTMPGSPKAVYWNIVDQLSGQAFLQIRQALKGAGQVTDYEGAKGEAAISRMKSAAESGNSDAFNQAVIDFKTAIDNGMRLLRETANGGYAQGAPAVTGAPQGGAPGGYTVLGVE